MKQSSFLFLLILLFTTTAFSAENQWRITGTSPGWARAANAFTQSVDKATLHNGQPAGKVVHTAPTDWAVRYPSVIKVQPGEIYEISCYVKTTESASVSTGVTLRAGNDVLSWVYGGHGIYGDNEWTELKSRFIVPPKATSIEPRLTGSGNGTVWFDVCTIKKVGVEKLAVSDKKYTLENKTLKVVFESQHGTFSVLDKRIGRNWEQIQKVDNCSILSARKNGSNQVDFKLLYCESGIKVNASLLLEKDLPELVVTIDADPKLPLSGNLSYPRPFKGVPGDRILMPVNEGISWPVEEKEPGISSVYTYGGHGLCMSFYGQIRDDIDPARSNGWLGIVETPDDAGVELQKIAITDDPPKKLDMAHNVPFVISYDKPHNADKTLALAPWWQGQKKCFGYKRSLRYVFFDQGGHVALCKRYKEYVTKTGLYVPFTEKIKRNPNLAQGIDLLIGAANIWGMGQHSVTLVKEMKELGMSRILWSAGGSAESLKALNEMGNVLTSRYDIYQDLMNPELISLTNMTKPHSDWTQDAWPQDVNWISPNGTMRRGWSIDAKDKTKPRVPCVVLCDSRALPYAEKRIGDELKTKPYKARFLDTTVAAPWFECWNPEHPMTRSDSRVWKMKLLELMGKRFNLVCGSETGHEASVPYCDFYEGMMSLGPYRVPESGRYLEKIWDDVPARTAKYQTGESFRLPLWELVYHDCTVSYWYWGDYNNKLPKLWRKRDLFNALYGVPPMYLFNGKYWKENKQKIAESYKVAEPVSRLTGMSEMTDHRILSKDRTVQQTVYANGYKVTVNFGTNPFTLSDGTILPANDLRIDK